jgi:hypothetical protein
VGIDRASLVSVGGRRKVRSRYLVAIHPGQSIRGTVPTALPWSV